MTHAGWQGDDLYALFDDLCDGSISHSDAACLDELLGNDAAARWEYLCYLDVHAGLGLIGAKGNDSGGVLSGGRGLGTSVPSGMPIVAGSALWAVGSSQASAFKVQDSDSTSHPSPFIICPSPTIHYPLSTALSSLGSILFSYLVAALILGVAMLIAGLWKLPDDRQIARQSVPLLSPLSPLPTMVGRITGMVDCRWERTGLGIRDWGLGKESGAENRQSLIPNPQSLVSLGDKFVLSSGLLEITYDTGAKVILQGPVTYEVEAKDGGFLSVGKLTARVEGRGARGEGPAVQRSAFSVQRSSNPQSLIPNPSSLSTNHYPLFTIKTPTATVTDLGTEFGVEVARNGVSEVQVLAGKVELAARSGSGRLRLIAGSKNSAARVDAESRGIVRLPAAPERFVRTISNPIARNRVRVDWSGFQPRDTFTVAKNDLLQTNLLAASTDDPDAPFFPDQSLADLYDGIMYRKKARSSSDCCFAVHDGKSVTFALDTRVNTQGYTIDAIDVYSGWYDFTRVGQKYKVEFSQVGQAGWLPSPVATLDCRGSWEQGFVETASHIENRTRNTPLVAHVERIRFTFYNVRFSGVESDQRETIYREIDVFGSPTRQAQPANDSRPIEKDDKP